MTAGTIPNDWAAKISGASSWTGIDVQNNTCLCGALPAWWTQETSNNAAYINGNQGGSCAYVLAAPWSPIIKQYCVSPVSVSRLCGTCDLFEVTIAHAGSDVLLVLQQVHACQTTAAAHSLLATSALTQLPSLQ
jgi:hypothetical protein